ncbi:MAG: IPT/TIG domain-containing protein, partial [Thermoanaerobaculia bacterium]
GSESVTVPNSPTGSARVRVSCVGNIFFDLSNANFTILAGAGAPTVGSVLPATGSEWGATVVTLNGTGFVSGATVEFGGVAAASVTFNGPTSLTATTPIHLPGVVGITVTNPDTQAGSLLAAFTFFPDLPWSDGFETGDWLRWSAFQN